MSHKKALLLFLSSLLITQITSIQSDLSLKGTFEGEYVTLSPDTKVKIINTESVEKPFYLFINGKQEQLSDDGSFLFPNPGQYKITMQFYHDPDFHGLFADCQNLLQVTVLDIKSKTSDASDMFRNCRKLISANLELLDTSNIVNMKHMFAGCHELLVVDLSKINTGNLEKMDGMFSNCIRLRIIEFGNFNTAKVTSMENLFSGCENIETVNISKFKTNRVTSIMGMFSNCKKLEFVDFSNFNTDKLTDTAVLFSGCENLRRVDFKGFEGKNVFMMNYMFKDCKNLEELNLGDLHSTRGMKMDHMFEGCSSLRKLNLRNLVVYEEPLDMFKGAKADMEICINRYEAQPLVGKLSPQAFVNCRNFY